MGSTHASWLMAAMLNVAADSPKSPPPQLTRPSDLPIYDTPPAEEEESAERVGTMPAVRAALLPPVRAARVQVQEVLRHTDSWKQAAVDTYNETEARTAWIVKYLREEENKDQRYGAVAMGGLTGLIFGSRGGIIKKLLYATIGTGVMGAVCFPEQTENIAKGTLASGRHYMNVAYNFCYGVKPGDPQLEVKFPELSFPKSFSEFGKMSMKLACTVKQAIMPPPSKDEQATAKPDSKA